MAEKDRQPINDLAVFQQMLDWFLTNAKDNSDRLSGADSLKEELEDKYFKIGRLFMEPQTEEAESTEQEEQRLKMALKFYHNALELYEAKKRDLDKKVEETKQNIESINLRIRKVQERNTFEKIKAMLNEENPSIDSMIRELLELKSITAESAKVQTQTKSMAESVDEKMLSRGKEIKSFFISLREVDIERVRDIKERLEKEGFKVWWMDDVDLGDDWEERIDIELSNVDAVVLMITLHFIENPKEIQHEIERADELKIPVIPFYMDDVDLSKVNYRIADRIKCKQGIEYRSEETDDQRCNRFIKKIKDMQHPHTLVPSI